MPQTAAICVTRNGRAFRWGSHEGIMLASNGAPVGISLTSRLALDAFWHGSPERWARLGTGELDGRLKELGAATRRGLVRVTLNFRSPKTAQAGASRFDRDEDDTDGNSPSAVRNVLGWVMPGNRVRVLARLNPKTTARLEHIAIHPAEGDPVEAHFTASLKHFGAFVVTPKTPLDGALAASDADEVAGPAHYESAPRYKSDALGLTVRDLTYDVRRHMQMKPDAPGVVVSKVEAGGKCSVAGLKPYELVAHINDQPVSTVKDFEKLAVPGAELKFSVKRMLILGPGRPGAARCCRRE